MRRGKGRGEKKEQKEGRVGGKGREEEDWKGREDDWEEDDRE